jgi:AraC-like DNA-binding protein
MRSPISAETAVQTASFSASSIPEQHRDAFIREYYGRIQMRLELEPDPEHPVVFDARSLILPEMVCTTASLSPMTWHRTSTLMADGNDDIAMSWNRGGHRIVVPGRGELTTRPGAAAIISHDRPWTAQTRDSRWTMALQVKRSVLAPLVKNLDDVPPDHIGREQAAHRLLFDYLSSLLAAPSPEALATLASRHIVDLLAASLGAGRSEPPAPGIRAARLAGIKQHVIANLRDPALSAEQVSRKFGISARYIRQLFAEEGTSFSDYVVEQRLAYVHSCLLDRRQLLRRIADIALEVGFAEPSTFYRQFRLRYGRTPTEVRQSLLS